MEAVLGCATIREETMRERATAAAAVRKERKEEA